MSDDLGLSADQRRLVGNIWAERARSELGAGSGFAQVVVGLYSIGAASEVLSLATDAAHQEVEHAKSCHRLAELYLGEAVPMPPAKKVGMPPHKGADDVLRATLHVVGLCCLNETIASEFVARCLDASTHDAVRSVGSIHLRDEIGHARVGWAHLGSGILDAPDRRVVSTWLPRIVKANAELWMERLLMLPEAGVDGHGYPPRKELAAGVRKALREVVVPGFWHVGLDATAAARVATAI